MTSGNEQTRRDEQRKRCDEEQEEARSQMKGDSKEEVKEGEEEDMERFRMWGGGRANQRDKAKVYEKTRNPSTVSLICESIIFSTHIQ